MKPRRAEEQGARHYGTGKTSGLVEIRKRAVRLGEANARWTLLAPRTEEILVRVDEELDAGQPSWERVLQ